MMKIDIDVDAIAEAVAKRINPSSHGQIIWNCPNALVTVKQVAEFTGYGVRSINNFMNEYGAPAPVRLSEGSDRRWFVKDVINYLEKKKRH